MFDQTRVFRLDKAAQNIIDVVRGWRGGIFAADASTAWWLLAVSQMYGASLADFAEDLDVAVLEKQLKTRPLPRHLAQTIEERTVLAAADGVAMSRSSKGIRADHLAIAILSIAGYKLKNHAGWRGYMPRPDASTQPPSTSESDSILAQFGVDLTAKAHAGQLPRLVGRAEEVQTLIEVLCRTTKRNPVLVGPPGVGKTAIAEGLAIRVAHGEVPKLLHGYRVIAVHPAFLAAGVQQQSELQERVKRLIEEAATGRVILFIDEVHALVGMGGDAGANDLATLFKPALSRGEIAVVAATTDAEFRRFIQGDGALERRFQPIRIQELSKEATLELLRVRREGFRQSRGVTVGDDVLSWIIEFTDSHLRSRFFPDKAIDMLEQCVAFAAARSDTALTVEQARSVGERTLGMPAQIEERIEGLSSTLTDRGLLSEDDASSLISNLHVRMRGFGVSPEQPDGVILLLDGAASAGGLLGETIAEALYGSPDRVVALDFGRLTDPQNLPLLLGAPPSYVGYDQTAPIHALMQAPWSVVLIENVQAAHPLVHSVLEQALDTGYFTDGAGRRVYLSDTVVVMTANTRGATVRELPEPATTFEGAPDAESRARAEHVLGASLIAICDIVTSSVPKRGAGMLSWFESDLLSQLAERFAQRGLDVTWHPTVYAWLAKEQAEGKHRRNWERLLDERIASLLIQWVPPAEQRARVTVGYGPDGVTVITAPPAWSMES